jgi:hypothetical protein
LLDHLGGAAHVAAVCKDIPPHEITAPELRHADGAEQAPYGHLFATLRALAREAEEAIAGRACLSRVQLDRHGLILLQRRVPRHMPQHLIWLDATGDAAFYRELFGRPVEVVAPDVALTGRVYQVWSSLNTKRQTVRDDGDGVKVSHLRQQVAQVRARGSYQRLGVVSYQDVAGELGADEWLHFYGARGTNRMQDVDALVVVGTPQPDGNDLLRTATMAYHERTAPFTAVWSAQDRPYAGQPWAYPTSHYWDDDDLRMLLSQFREAELVQALHRARPLRRDVDVYLLTNLPLPGVPVRLLSLHQLFDAPAGVDPYRWPEVLRVAEERMAAVGRVTTQDFSIGLGADNRTASAWLDGLIAQGWHETARVPSATRGRPVRAICKDFPPK